LAVEAERYADQAATYTSQANDARFQAQELQQQATNLRLDMVEQMQLGTFPKIYQTVEVDRRWTPWSEWGSTGRTASVSTPVPLKHCLCKLFGDPGIGDIPVLAPSGTQRTIMR